MKVLRATNIGKCIGCHACSLACARLVHKRLSWDIAGIRIKSSGGLTTGSEALLCLACKPAACSLACPTGACAQRKDGGVRINRKICIQCGKCAAACPATAMFFEPHLKMPFVCLHCGQCVKFCPHDCLEMVEQKPFAASDDSQDASSAYSDTSGNSQGEV